MTQNESVRVETSVGQVEALAVTVYYPRNGGTEIYIRILAKPEDWLVLEPQEARKMGQLLLEAADIAEEADAEEEDTDGDTD